MASVNKYISELSRRLEQKGISSSRVNAEIMVSHVLGLCISSDLYTRKVELGLKQQALLQEMARRRLNGEPLQYITGNVSFYENELFIEKGVFIPRPETEILVKSILDLVERREKFAEIEPLILDLCTGSGNIAISLTKSLSRCKIIASDISDKAIGLARKNARLNKVEERIEFIKADLLDLPVTYSNSFSIIASNPPYVARDILKGLPDEVKKEPYEALDGGDNGTLFYSRIIEGAPRFLKKGGLIALELGDNLCNRVEELFQKQADIFGNISIFKDLNNIERVIIAERL